jgi:NADH dehydrogenase FAD-containing subunit
VGAGHAHLHVLAHATRLQALGRTVRVVDPGDFWYSGLATGALSGRVPPEANRLELADLARRAHVELIRDRVVGFDGAARRVLLESGNVLSYEFLSFNVGSEVDLRGMEVELEAPSVWPAKPISGLARLREAFQEALGQGGVRAVVVGGGATGSELAASLAELARRRGSPGAAGAEVSLLSDAPELIPEAPRGASRSLRRALERRGVRVVLRTRVTRVTEGQVRTEGGPAHPASFIVLATGLRPPSVLADLGLTSTSVGLRVDETLRSVDDSRVFGVGDCIDFAGRDLPKLGVFGVRQAPVLLENLTASLTGRSLTPYRPQRRWLSILNLGRGEGLATWGPFWWRGRLSLRLKDRLDQDFLEGYRTRPAPLEGG